MKILHVLPSISKGLGGPTFLTFSLVRELIRQGIAVEIISTDDDGEKTLNLKPGVLSEYEGVPCRVFKRSFLRRHEYIVSPSMASWLWRNVTDYNLLDIHYLFTFSASIASAAAINKNVPYTIRTMGQLSPWALSQNKLLKSIHFSLFERWMLSYASAVQCTSVGEKADVKKSTKSPSLEVLPLGVELPTLADKSSIRSRLNFSINDFLLLFLSRLHKKKRAEFIIDLLPMLPLEVKLLLAGSGEPEYENSLKVQVKRLNLEGRVKFLGHVDRVTGEELRQTSDLFVLPSFSDNFSLATAEALASSLPVVITPEVQIAPYIKDSNSGLVIEASLDKWRDEISKLINDKKALVEMSQNARALADKEFSIKSAALRLIELYRQILSQNRLP